MPRDDDLRLTAVRDDRETRPLDREVALVRLHGGHDYPLGQLKEALVEAAFEHDRLLDQVDDLVELAAGIAPASNRVEPFDDLAPPLFGDRLDVGRSKRFHVGRRAGNRDSAVREAVAEGRFANDRLVVELREHPAHRARETDPALIPSHRPREREAAHDPVDLLGENLAKLAAGKGDAEEAIAQFELVDA